MKSCIGCGYCWWLLGVSRVAGVAGVRAGVAYPARSRQWQQVLGFADILSTLYDKCAKQKGGEEKPPMDIDWLWRASNKKRLEVNRAG